MERSERREQEEKGRGEPGVSGGLRRERVGSEGEAGKGTEGRRMADGRTEGGKGERSGFKEYREG